MLNRKLRRATGEMLLIVCIVVGCHGTLKGEMHKRSFGGEEVSILDPKTKALMAEFKRHPKDREEVAKELLPVLKQVQSDHDVGVFLGKPDAISWHYTLFYSSSMSIHFDAASEVLRVVSDVMEMAEDGQASGREMDDLEIAAAASEFRSQPYSRQEAAKKLIHIITPGTKSEKVEKIFGQPNRRAWYYSLSHRRTSRLTIVFDPEGQLTETEIIAQ